jgi:HK97 family phage major capsid protein
MPDITTAAGLGEAITPEQWASFVLDHLSHQAVVLASGARLIRTDAKQIHVPRLLDDGGTGWYGELEEIRNDAPDGDDLVLTPRKIASLNRLSNESIGDSDADLLDTTGQAMLRAIALEADRCIFHGEGNKAPLGFLDDPELRLQVHDGAVDYEGIVTAAGMIRAVGGVPNVVYVEPMDYVALQLARDGTNRPLLQATTDGPAPVIAGLYVWPTPALDPGEAVVAQADQIVVALRNDASVAFSTDAAFNHDGTVARVIARLDAGINDPDGICVIGGGGS